MPVNPHFINYNLNGDNTNEQDLIKNLVQEAIQINGIDCFYLPKKNDNLSNVVLGEDVLTYFDDKFEIELYIKDTAFTGPSFDINGPTGWQIEDYMTFQISTKSWSEIVTGYNRPREGDLIYFPLSKTLFNITFVEEENQFYPRGTLPSWEIRAKIFNYNHEDLNTGIEEVDNINDEIDITDDSIFNQRSPDNKEIEDQLDIISTGESSDVWGDF